MKEQLITFFERTEHRMDLPNTSREYKKIFVDQCFGAVEFACQLLNDWEAEAEIIDLWNNEWRDRLEAKAYNL